MLRFRPQVNCLWLPADPETGADLAPTILFLHGVGERGHGAGELDLVKAWGLPKLRAERKSLIDGPFPFLVIAPQCPPDATWCTDGVLDALDRLLEDIVAHGDADASRLYVAGFSMGGIGAYGLALRQPRRFAAIASVCGRCPTPDTLSRLAALPQWVAYAEDDEIPELTDGSLHIIATLAPYGVVRERPYRLGATADASAHARTADAAFGDPELYRWLLQHKVENPLKSGLPDF